MQAKRLSLKGLILIDLDCHNDNRGYFTERFHIEKLNGLIPDLKFVQDNHSFSRFKVLRGMHFQKGQSKLISVIRGKVLDVTVDIRLGSETFGKHECVELDSARPQIFWVPDGFAHGFCILSEEGADVIYKTTTVYDPNKENGIFWADKKLGIKWPSLNPIISERDSKLISFDEFKRTYKS